MGRDDEKNPEKEDGEKGRDDNPDKSEKKKTKEEGNRKRRKDGDKSEGEGRDGESGKKKSTMRTVMEILRDIAIAALIVAIVMGILYAYSGVWPPPVVVESQSMSHNPEGERLNLPPSQIGVIDGGDMVIVKKVSSKNEITTYVQGLKTGYQTYGSYGDVVIYKPPQDIRYNPTPVIHRAVVWVEYNQKTNSWDVPDLNVFNSKSLISIPNYGYSSVTVYINLTILPHSSGFITMGDHNAAMYYHGGHETDQESGICFSPVQFDWIIGVARGELPWFGGLKLWLSGNTGGVPENSWWYLGVSIVLLIFIPLILDFVIERIRKKRKKERENRKEREKKEKSDESKEKPPDKGPEPDDRKEEKNNEDDVKTPEPEDKKEPSDDKKPESVIEPETNVKGEPEPNKTDG
jgi:signal peptidase